MKKIYNVFAMAAFAIAAASCVQEQFEPDMEEVSYGGEVIVSAALPYSADTKISYEMDEAGKVMKTAWEEGDVIYYTTGSGSGTAFTQTGPISEDGKFTQFAANMNLSANKKMLFTYPISYKTSSGGNLRMYSHDGSLEQVMKDNDYLYGFVTTDASKVLPNVELKRLSAFLEIKDLTFPADVNATITRIYVMSPSMGNRAYLNTSTEELTIYRDATMVINPVEYKIVNGKVEGDKVLYTAFIPTAEAAEGDECSLMFQTEDGTIYEKKWKAGSVYTAGNMYSVTGEVVKPVTFNIQFEDPNVKNILVGNNNWYGCDKNGDGELSNVEASLITTLNWMFYEVTNIEKFNEFVYFTGVSTFIGSNSSGGGGFYGCTSLKEITLPPSVTVIGSDAFNGCTSLETFTVPATVKKINAGAFRNCTALKEITIPSTVSYMGEGQTFRGCTSLKTVVWPSATTTIPSATFAESGLETFTIPENITEIGQQAFMSCPAVKSITIPASVKSIGASAFANCTGITEITVPSGVTTIGNEAFFNTGLKTVSIPASVTSIGQKAFNQNPALTKFTIESGSPYSVSDDVSVLVKTSGTTVEAVGFFGNKSEIVFPENVTKIGNNFANGASSLEKVTIPAVTSFGSSTFAGCANLTTAVFAAGAATTGNNTFQNCTSLVNVTLPEAATQLGTNLFYGCTSLKSLTIPSAVTKIGNGVFQNCSSLEEVSLPSSLKEIPNDLFNGCASLKKLVIPSSVTKLGQRSLSGCAALTEVVIPEGITDIPNAFMMECTGIKTITLPESVKTINQNAFKGSGLTSFTFPSKVTKISSNTFANCKDLKSITIPSTITDIDMYAFEGCGLESVTIPEGVKEIKMYTFQKCESLATVTLSSTVTKIAMYAFSGCTALKTINWPSTLTTLEMNAFQNCTSLETVVIPASVTKLGNSVFDGCSNLKNVTLPSGMTSLGVWTFQNCTSLKTMTIPATVTSLGSSTFNGCTAMEDVVLESLTPCNVSPGVFPLTTNEDFVIYVPDEAIDAYKAHASWSVEDFAGRIFAVSTR